MCLPGNEPMKKSVLILGDLLAITLVTLIGFAAHGEADMSFLPRMAVVYFPLSISWFLLAPALGHSNRKRYRTQKNVGALRSP